MVAPRHVFLGSWALSSRYPFSFAFHSKVMLWTSWGGGGNDLKGTFFFVFFPFPSQGTLTRQHPAVG
jgi:hypothetical protein